MWKYRDWVIDALNRDMPFDQFTIEQIAGDMLPDPTPEQLHRERLPSQRDDQRGGRHRSRGGACTRCSSIASTRPPPSGSASTLGCAQCHNHKYDPFTQKDYYRMMAFFQNNDYEVKTFGDGTRFFEPTIDVPTPEQDAKRKTIQAEIDRLNEQHEGQTARARTRRRPRGSRRCGWSRHAAWRSLTPATARRDRRRDA